MFKQYAWAIVGGAFILASLLVSSATAQQAPTTARDASAGQFNRPHLAPVNTGSPGAPELLAQNGGSLMRATMAARPDPSRATFLDVSYFAVPEPEPRTIKKHDLVTIVIRENSTSSSEANTDMSKQASIDAHITDFVKLNIRNLAIEGGNIGPNPPGIAANGKTEFKGEGKTDRTDSFEARITAEVLDVKPNGTLVLQARKRIKTDDDEQQFILTGICRAEDVSADNTVLSTQLYDLDLEKNNSGMIRNNSQRGWLPKLLDLINPF